MIMKRFFKKTLSAPAGLLLLGALLFAAGCGGETATVTVSTPPPPGTKTYGKTPEAASELIRDTSSIVRTRTVANSGVHFKLEMSTTVSGQVIISQGEGDMIFPDRTKMTLSTYTSGQPVSMEVIAIEGKVYTKQAGGNWSSVATGFSMAEPQNLTGFLDYARSSRIVGEEILRGGRKTYHIQVDIDSYIAAEEAKKGTSDPVKIQELEKTKAATVTVDFWIGVDDLLIYQELVKTSNPATALSSSQTFIFSDWGETVLIEKPCADC